jgi:hypothetical protein
MDKIQHRIDRQIAEAEQRGAFADLPGAGKPLPDAGEPLHEDWWLRSYIRRGELGTEALPTTLRLRKEVEDLPATLARKRDEAAVREAVADLNKRIRSAMIGPVDGPAVSLRVVDVDDALRVWRQDRR